MHKKGYNKLILDIGQLLEEGRRRALQSVNAIIVKTYWEKGRRIVDFEDNNRKTYGSKLFEQIANDLRHKYGKGFSRSNIIYMRLLYRFYPKSQTLSDQLSWSHYIELLRINNKLEKGFYGKECTMGRWDVRELRRQIESQLFYRLPAGKKGDGFLQLSSEGHKVQTADDIIKNPYVFEFLKLPEPYSEKELEDKIIANLKMFLLELGRSFTFVARQFRMKAGKKHFYADLVFYNKTLRCYVIIDLKIGEISHKDIGQMNLYLNYFKSKVNSEGDNEPVGIILSRNNETIEIKYALGGVTNQIFASKYQLSLPSPDDLKKVVEHATKQISYKAKKKH